MVERRASLLTHSINGEGEKNGDMRRGRREENHSVARSEEGGCLSHTFFFPSFLESFLLLLKEPASRLTNHSSKYINEG